MVKGNSKKWLWIGIGVLILIVIIICIVVFLKKKKKKNNDSNENETGNDESNNGNDDDNDNDESSNGNENDNNNDESSNENKEPKLPTSGVYRKIYINTKQKKNGNKTSKTFNGMYYVLTALLFVRGRYVTENKRRSEMRKRKVIVLREKFFY